MSTVAPVKKQRKPRTKKADMIKLKEEKAKQIAENNNQPKKRGRKPKGGKIIKSEQYIHEEVIEEKTIIMHLKCKLSDLIDDTSITNQIDNYNPNINNFEPYQEPNNFELFSKNNENNYEVIDNKDEQYIQHNIIDKRQPPQIAEHSNSSNNTNNYNKETEKKIINSKLKELEQNLNSNNVKNESSCFWCTYDFNSMPIHIPSLYFKGKYDVYGCFCSPECACSYLFRENIDDNTKFERYQLLNYVYGKIYNYNKNIKPAPNPYYTLNKYHGNLSIQEYRQLLEYDRLLLVIDKPLTKIYPELHEDNNNFETIYENKISLKRKNKVDKNKILTNVFSN